MGKGQNTKIGILKIDGDKLVKGLEGFRVKMKKYSEEKLGEKTAIHAYVPN